MAHTITETPTFTPTIVVPDGTDTMVAAAETVAAIAQGLANRTRLLKQVTDDAVTKSGNNTFTGTNTFSGATTLNAPTINGNISAADGTVNVSGNLTVASAVQAASAVITGGARIDGNITANDGVVNVSGGLVTSGDVSGSSLTTSGDVILTGNTKDIVYSAASLPVRYVNIPMVLGERVSSNGTYDTLFDTWGLTAGGGAATIRFPVPTMPRGSFAIGLEAAWRAHAVAAANQATLRVNAQAAWGIANGELVAATDPADIITLTHDVGFSATLVTKSTLFLPQVHTVNNAAEAYFIDVRLLDGPNNRLFALRAYYLDPGARNG
jgi:cytoskeletal protein CcmA (bactofilin family)